MGNNWLSPCQVLLSVNHWLGAQYLVMKRLVPGRTNTDTYLFRSFIYLIILVCSVFYFEKQPFRYINDDELVRWKFVI